MLMTGGAWLFALGTLATLVVLATLHWPIATTQTRIASTTTDGHTYDAFGLTYIGVGGAVLLWTQVILLLSAIIVSTRSATWPRRAAHVMLVSWAALWLANGLWLPLMDEGNEVTALAVGGVLGALLVCTVYRARRRWPRPEA